eukprot:EG_transcript_8713
MGTRTTESYLYDLSLMAKAKALAAEKRVVKATKRLRGGQEVCIVKGNLTEEKADAVVNAANGRLEHAAGLARALVEAGGPSIQDECSAYIDKYKEVKPGNVVWSNPGTLPCKLLLHAVGPVWDGGDSGEVQVLADCVRNCLAVATKKGFASISLPAIGSGIFGFPKRLCAQVMLRTIYDYFWATKSCLKKVCLTNHDDETVDIFLAVLKEGYDSWGAAMGVKVAVVYVMSDITQVVPDDPAMLVHFVAVGRKWSDRGVMGKLTKTFGDSVKTKFDAEHFHDLGSVSVVKLAEDLTKGKGPLSLCHVFALRKDTCAMDYDALAVGLKKAADMAKKAHATVHLEKPHGVDVEWPAVHRSITEAFVSQAEVFVHTNDAGDLAKYNAPLDSPKKSPASPAKRSAAASSTSTEASPAKRPRPGADRNFCSDCGAALTGAKTFCSACGARQA